LDDTNETTHEVMTAEEAAAYLRLAPVTLYRLAGKGEIPGVKIGRLWRFKKSELERWLEREARSNVSGERPPGPAPAPPLEGTMEGA
jgi:excisionase family DNA binding protein